MGTNNFAVETFSLTKVFGDWWGRPRVVAVDDMNLQVPFGQIFGLLGPNGAGKTTLIKMLLSLLHPTRGRALVLGGDSRDPKISSQTGFLPEESYLYPYLTARETLDFYGTLFKLSPKLRKARIDALLEMVGLSAVANRQVGTFSKGMARRIGLAQAMINDPQLLILDEPTSGLDPLGTRQIKDLIVELGRRGKTVLLSSHLLADAEEICDQIAIMYGGKIQRHGPVKELLTRSDRIQITADCTDASLIDKIRSVAGAAKLEIVSPVERLESYFIRVVEQARSEALPTSGAVGGGKMDAYFQTTDKGRAILDRLVRADIDSIRKKVQTERVKAAHTAETQRKTDKQLLEKLAGRAETVKTEKIDKKVDAQPLPKAESVNKEILDKLINPDSAGDKSNA